MQNRKKHPDSFLHFTKLCKKICWPNPKMLNGKKHPDSFFYFFILCILLHYDISYIFIYLNWILFYTMYTHVFKEIKIFSLSTYLFIHVFKEIKIFSLSTYLFIHVFKEIKIFSLSTYLIIIMNININIKNQIKI